MSPLDHELSVTLGELVLARRHNKAAAEKEALFKGIGSGLDWTFNKGRQVAAPAARALGRGAAKLPGKAYNIAMEAGGVHGITNEAKLLKLLQVSPKHRASWDAVRALAQSKGYKNPVTAFKAFFNPMQSLTPRVSEGGYARWLLNELKDPLKRQQFLVGATPDQIAHVKRLEPFFSKAHQAGEISTLGKIAPLGIIGGPVAYNLAKGGDSGERPVVSSPNPGFQQPAPKKPGMLEKFWGQS